MVTFYSFRQFKCLGTKAEAIVRVLSFVLNVQCMSKKTFSLDNGLSPHLLLRDVFKYVIKMDETGEYCITKYDFAHGVTGARKTTTPFTVWRRSFIWPFEGFHLTLAIKVHV